MVAASPSTVSFRTNDHPTASNAKAAPYLNEMAKVRDRLSLIRHVPAAAMGTGGRERCGEIRCFFELKALRMRLRCCRKSVPLRLRTISIIKLYDTTGCRKESVRPMKLVTPGGCNPMFGSQEVSTRLHCIQITVPFHPTTLILIRNQRCNFLPIKP